MCGGWYGELINCRLVVSADCDVVDGVRNPLVKILESEANCQYFAIKDFDCWTCGLVFLLYYLRLVVCYKGISVCPQLGGGDL
jgi:hypothetical protein